jgi:hypothetical protein
MPNRDGDSVAVPVVAGGFIRPTVFLKTRCAMQGGVFR